VSTLLFSEPAKSTRLIFPVSVVLLEWSIIVASTVRTACDREECLLRLVAPTERFFVACLRSESVSRMKGRAGNARIYAVEFSRR
jgi:hypothetical protein